MEAGMVQGNLPPAVQQFLKKFINSVEQLEVLLILHEFPNRAWTAGEISTQLRSTALSVEQRLAGLMSQGLVKPSGNGFQYGPVNPDCVAAVAQLAALYKERRIQVIES